MPKFCRPDGSCREWKTPYLRIPGTHYETLPELYEKYHLSICWLYYDIAVAERGVPAGEWLTHDELQEKIYTGIKHHWLVCQYLEEHPDAAKRYLAREVGWWYYDILNRAEEEYA